MVSVELMIGVASTHSSISMTLFRPFSSNPIVNSHSFSSRTSSSTTIPAFSFPFHPFAFLGCRGLLVSGGDWK